MGDVWHCFQLTLEMVKNLPTIRPPFTFGQGRFRPQDMRRHRRRGRFCWRRRGSEAGGGPDTLASGAAVGPGDVFQGLVPKG